jgi:hypothetical protein
VRWAIGLTSVYPSTSKASPNDPGVVVIIVVVIVGEEGLVFHKLAGL